MKTTAHRLPGKSWRVLSFIPAINWISLLYIGIINSNIANILFSIVYYVLGYTIVSISPLLWIIGIVHYALAYNSVKNLDDNIVKNPNVQPRAIGRKTLQQDTRYAQGFSDITITGSPERRETIPKRARPVSEQVQITYGENPFFIDMQKFAHFEGEPAAFVPFMTYYPTYDSMDRNQRAWYFYWRTQLRQGNYLETDLSYIFIVIYEILSGVGWQDAQEGHAFLNQLWSAYRNNFPKLDNYLSTWIFDFSRQHNLFFQIPEEVDMVYLYPSVIKDILVDQHAKDVPFKLSFALIDMLCDYSLTNSKFYKDGNQELMQEAIPRVIALVDISLRKSMQKGILAVYGPNHPKNQDYYLFRGAICPQANQMVTISIKAYSSNPKLRTYINEIVRYCENTLRALRGFRGRLRGITLDEGTAKLVKLFLDKEYDYYRKQDIIEARSEIVLDYENIDLLREQSDAVRAALHVEEDAKSIVKEFLTDVQEITSIYIALSAGAHEFLGHLEQCKWECEFSPSYETSISEVNRIAEHYLGCTLLVKEGAIIMVKDDYRDELEYIYKNPPHIKEPQNARELFDSSALSPELKEFVEILIPDHQKALYTILTYESPQRELEKIAEDSMTMPQILLDEINETAMQTLGDLIIDSLGQEPVIIDEYLSELKQSVV